MEQRPTKGYVHILCLCLAGCLADASAETTSLAPANKDDRKGSAAQKLGDEFDAEDATFAMINDSGDEIPLFNGTQIVVDCTDLQMVCWSMGDADDITLTLATMEIDDAGGSEDGEGPCARVQAGTYRTMVLDLDVFDDSTAVGRRTSSCSGSTHAGRPCRTNTDCPGASDCTVTGGITQAFLYASAATCAWVVE